MGYSSQLSYLFYRRKFYYSVFLLLVAFLLLISKQEYILGVVVENNPFYGMSNAKINSIESTTIDNFIRVKLEYSPNLVDPNSPEFFKFTLTYTDTSEIVKHADSDIIVSKDGVEVYKASDEFSTPLVHTPNGLVLMSYVFPDPGTYIISVNIVGIYFNPIDPKQVNFTANIGESNNKYDIGITT